MSDIPAGRELDALVAERVFGDKRWRAVRIPLDGGTELRLFCTDATRPAIHRWYDGGGSAFSSPSDFPELPEYSTDIAAAWQVVEKMREYSGGVGFELSRWVDGWLCTFGSKNYPIDVWGEADGDNAAHAICLAALRAVETHSQTSETDAPR